MQKGSSGSSRGSRPGAGNKYKKDGGSGRHTNEARPFKKNYDGRGPATGEGKASRSAKPYSGRVADVPSQRPFGKPSFSKENEPRGWNDADRKPLKEFDKPQRKNIDDKPFSDRPKRQPADRQRSFDKPAFKKDDRNLNGAHHKPRRDGDQPFRDGNESTPFRDRPKRSFDKPDFKKDDRNLNGGHHKPRRDFEKPFRGSNERTPFRDRTESSFDNPGFKKDVDKEDNYRKPRKEFNKPGKPADSRPFRERPKTGFEKKVFKKEEGKENKLENKPRTFSDVVNNAFNQPAKKKGDDKDYPGKRQQFDDKVYGELDDVANDTPPKRPFEVRKKKVAGKKKHFHDHSEGRKKKYKDEDDEQDDEDKEINQKDGPRLEMPLNKYIAHSGECSRRDAAELVRQGKVKVNEELILDPGYRVQHDDRVTMSGKKLTPQKGNVYILLNKPKGYITTNDDPQGRKTVMELVKGVEAQRLFPVGRLDRDTSGLLLITNDGELTQKLSHPAYKIKKVYQVTLDKPLTKADFDKIIEGVELEDGKAIVDELAYLEKKTELGLEIHSGRNRIVRRIFESLGYVVEKLDRMMYAGLTKKNLPRSKWRYLDEREVVLLKHFKN